VQQNDPAYRCALILLDLDRFKEANDTFGHAVGDRVLEHVGTLLTDLVRRADYVARLGGDEFVILLDGAGRREDVRRIVTGFLTRVNEPIVIDGDAHVRIGASLGIAVLGQDTDSELELIRLADAAMYRAKHAGRNTYRFHGE
jgi:diguanylate cyclase (GGDEF)-like protein